VRIFHSPGAARMIHNALIIIPVQSMKHAIKLQGNVLIVSRMKTAMMYLAMWTVMTQIIRSGQLSLGVAMKMGMGMGILVNHV